MDKNNYLICGLMVLILILLIVDICKRKKDEGFSGEAASEDAGEDDYTGVIIGVVAGVVVIACAVGGAFALYIRSRES